MRRVNKGLVAAIVLSVLATVGAAVGLVLLDPGQPKGEAIKTGGLVGASVVALYALWLNDRRRRVDEAKHELESDKVADERFARAVELLGHDADQVRVGALHALAGLARATPRYRQTVLDVLCAYLRRPFEHPAYEKNPDDPARWGAARGTDEQELERTVRLTAQGLITDLLPWGLDDPEQRFNLNLSGANVEYLRLEGRRVGRCVMRRTRFHGVSRFAGASFSKPALFSGAAFLGRVELRDCDFAGGLSLQEAEFRAGVDARGARVGQFAHLADAPPPELRGGLRVVGEVSLRGGPRAGWNLEGDAPAGDDAPGQGDVPGKGPASPA
ncbi:pentapeptide repeat-containing protein [Actinosynnema sp.]|uniref:pentapeptide repeat-containing protein n=1 Tax=Actinosynnema sp. TaxID=1872144 RepID=UPI003F829A49